MPESSPPTVVSLMPHPAAGPGPALAVVVEVGWHPTSGLLSLDYLLDVGPSALRLPTPANPRRADGLWRHTCFEAFTRADGRPGYLEFNWSPSGEWAAYAFDARREGMRPLELKQDPATGFAREPGRWRLHAGLQLPEAFRGPIRLGLAAVVEARDGTLHYWALRHGHAAAPDFHDPESFTLRLGSDGMDAPG